MWRSTSQEIMETCIKVDEMLLHNIYFMNFLYNSSYIILGLTHCISPR